MQENADSTDAMSTHHTKLPNCKGRNQQVAEVDLTISLNNDTLPL